MDTYDSYEEFFSHNLAPNNEGQMPVISFVGRGIQGPQGEQGEQGRRGLRGPAGAAGAAGTGNTKIAFIEAQSQDYDIMQQMNLAIGDEYDFPCDSIYIVNPTAPTIKFGPISMDEFVSTYNPVMFLGLWPVKQFTTSGLRFIGINEYIGNRHSPSICMRYRNTGSSSGVTYFSKSVIRGAVLLTADSLLPNLDSADSEAF